MRDAIDLITSRRSVAAAQLGEPGPDDAQIRTLIAAAVRVPDHGKLAPWRFILVRAQARNALAARLLALREAREGPLPEHIRAAELSRFPAPVCLAVVSRAGPHPKIPEWEQLLSVGAAVMNLLNAANALGFGAQWLTDWPAYDAQAAGVLGLAQGERLAGFVHIGTAQQPPAERWRPAVEDVLSEWTGG